MEFTPPLKQGRFIKRYKRFFADIEDENGDLVTAHVPNTGSMKGLLTEGSPCLYSSVDDPKRKLKFTLQMLKTPTSWVGVNTHLPNKIVLQAWQDKLFSHWQDYPYAQPEFKVSKETRLDLLLSKTPPKKKFTSEDLEQHTFHLIEIKNVTLAEADNKKALFPDAVTTRGQKHLRHLIELIEKGHSCELFFLVQREDCTIFSPAKEIDPEYAELLKKAQNKGLLISAYACDLNSQQIKIDPQKKLQIDI